MDRKALVFLTLMIVAAAYAKETDLWKKRSESAEGRDYANLAGNNNAQKQRQMRQMAANFRQAMMSKRGIFDCAGFLEECHVFKHCCGDWQCNYDHVFESGVCVIEFDK